MRKKMIGSFLIPLFVYALPEGIYHPKAVKPYSFGESNFHLFPEKKEAAPELPASTPKKKSAHNSEAVALTKPEGIYHPKAVEPYSLGGSNFSLFPEKKVASPVAPASSFEYKEKSAQYPEAVALAKQLYKAQQEKDPGHFFSILQQARRQFSSNKDALLTFFMTRSESGLTSLMIASITGDIVQIAALLRIVKTSFGGDKKAAAIYINAQEESGYTALMIVADVGTLKVVRELVDGVYDILQGNKKLFLRFLNTSDFLHFQNPLNILAFDSASSSLHYLVYMASKFFDQSSPEYDKFINWTDSNGLTALQYALSAEDRIFLIKNKAIIRKVIDKKTEEARALGRKLIDMVHYNNLEQVKKILYYAENKYKNNTVLFLAFISVRDSAGWLSLTHAVAQGKMVYVKLIVDLIEHVLKKDPTDIYNILSNVDYTGKNVLTVAVQREDFVIARYLVKKTMEYTPDKYWFFDFMINQNMTNGFAPLTTLVYRSSDVATFKGMAQFLIDSMASMFDMNSRQFNLYINLLDWNYYTALDYANTPEIQDVLKNYGARMGMHIIEEQDKELAIARAL